MEPPRRAPRRARPEPMSAGVRPEPDLLAMRFPPALHRRLTPPIAKMYGRPRLEPEESSTFRDAPSDIVVESPGKEGYVAAIALIGEHDLATADSVSENLSAY